MCEEIGLKWSDAKTLFNAQLLSFNPGTTRTLTEQQGLELRFVGNLMATCNSPDVLKKILSTLISPYAYSTAKIYYSWHKREWLQIPEELSLSKEVMSGYIQDLVEHGELDELLEHKIAVTSAIRKVRESSLVQNKQSKMKS